MEEGYAGERLMAGERLAVEKAAAIDRDASQVEQGTRRLDSALELLTKQASMLEERLARYLQPPSESGRLSSPEDDSRAPVDAAIELHRQAAVVERVADLLGELRERFEG